MSASAAVARPPIRACVVVVAWLAVLWGCGDPPSRQLSASHELVALRFRAADNLALTDDVAAAVSGTGMAATVPFGAAVDHLVATFETTGARVTVGDVPQVSGATQNDFTHPVTYRVAAEDGTRQDYTVTVTVAARHEITSFGFPAVRTGVTATIHRADRTITATVPFDTDVTRLVATFEAPGATVTVGAIPQVSGSTVNDFTSPVVYTVTAADGTAEDDAVTVTIAAATSAKQLTSFGFPAVAGVEVTIDELARTITAVVPYLTHVTALVAAFETTGAAVTVGGARQVSGSSRNDFTSPVLYEVFAEDGTSQLYTVIVQIGPRPVTGKEIVSFRFAAVGHGGVDATINATDRTIVALVPADTDVGTLVATFETTGASVTVAGAEQRSGTTANDFSHPVVYEVIADDGTSQTYAVTVRLAAGSAKDITSFGFPSLDHTVTGILGTAISVGVPAHTDVTQLIASFVTTGVLVTVGGVVQVSGATPNDFTHPLAYQVDAADGTSQTYTVTVQAGL